MTGNALCQAGVVAGSRMGTHELRLYGNDTVEYPGVKVGRRIGGCSFRINVDIALHLSTAVTGTDIKGLC